jgi:hypothetical protein
VNVARREGGPWGSARRSFLGRSTAVILLGVVHAACGVGHGTHDKSSASGSGGNGAGTSGDGGVTSASVTSSAAGGLGGAGGGDAGCTWCGVCLTSPPPPAAAPPGDLFVFHVHNGGTRMLRLAYSCGDDFPITVATPQGMLPISPGDEGGICDITCASVYADPCEGCIDCGPGVGDQLPPGATVDVPWHRLAYLAYDLGPKAVTCPLAQTATPSSAQAGVVWLCADGLDEPMEEGPGGPGFCAAAEEPASFTTDTTQAEGTVEVQ